MDTEGAAASELAAEAGRAVREEAHVAGLVTAGRRRRRGLADDVMHALAPFEAEQQEAAEPPLPRGCCSGPLRRLLDGHAAPWPGSHAGASQLGGAWVEGGSAGVSQLGGARAKDGNAVVSVCGPKDPAGCRPGCFCAASGTGGVGLRGSLRGSCFWSQATEAACEWCCWCPFASSCFV